MAFPATSPTLYEALKKLRDSSGGLKAYAADQKAKLAASSISANSIIEMMVNFQKSIDGWDAVASTPGLADYAKAQYSSATLDIVAEYQAMRSAAVAVVTWVQSNFPKDASGYLLKDQFDASAGLAVRSFTPAQTAGLQTALTSFIASVA